MCEVDYIIPHYHAALIKSAPLSPTIYTANCVFADGTNGCNEYMSHTAYSKERISHQDRPVNNTKLSRPFHSQIWIDNTVRGSFGRHTGRGNNVTIWNRISTDEGFQLSVCGTSREVVQRAKDVSVPCECTEKSLDASDTLFEGEDVKISGEGAKINQRLVESIRGIEFDTSS